MNHFLKVKTKVWKLYTFLKKGVQKLWDEEEQKWLIILTFIIILSATIIFIKSKNIEHAAQFGDFLAGFAGSLAFLWLIASFKQQQNELKIQREELSLQRKAIELQAQELKNIVKFSALEQVEKIVVSLLEKIDESKTPYKHPNEFLNAIANPDFIKNLDIFSDSTDHEEIAIAYNAWAPIEIELRYFIHKIAEASKIYLEQNNNIEINRNLSDPEFINKYQHEIKNIPYLSELAFSLQMFIPTFIAMEKYFKMMLLSSLAAQFIKLEPETREEINLNVFNSLKKELDEENIDHPAILKLYNK